MQDKVAELRGKLEATEIDPIRGMDPWPQALANNDLLVAVKDHLPALLSHIERLEAEKAAALRLVEECIRKADAGNLRHRTEPCWNCGKSRDENPHKPRLALNQEQEQG